MLLTIVFYAAIIIVVFFKLKQENKPFFNLRIQKIGLNISIVIVLTYCIQFISYLIIDLFNLPELKMGGLESSLDQNKSWVIFFFMILFAPLFEELIFRRLLFHSLSIKAGPALAFLISNLSFALIHSGWVTIIHAAILGCLYTFIYFITKSMFLSFLSHAFGNLIAFLLIFIFPGTPFYIDRINSFPQAIYLVFIILLSGFLFKKLLNIYAKTDHEQINHPNKKKQ